MTEEENLTDITGALNIKEMPKKTARTSPRTEAEMRPILDQWDREGWTLRQAAQITGVNKTTLRGWRKRLGRPPIRPRGAMRAADQHTLPLVTPAPKLPHNTSAPPTKFIAAKENGVRQIINPAYKEWAVNLIGVDGRSMSAVAKTLGMQITDLWKWKQDVRGNAGPHGKRTATANGVPTDPQAKRTYRQYSDEDKRRLLEAARAYPNRAKAAEALGVSANNLKKWSQWMEAGGQVSGPLVPAPQTRLAPSAREMSEELTKLRQDNTILRMIAQTAMERGLFSLDVFTNLLMQPGKGK